MTSNSSVAKHKSVFQIYDESDGTHHIFIRPVGSANGWYDIADEYGHISTDGENPNMDNVLINAKHVSDEYVAELVAKDEERQERLKRAESALREYVEFRKSWLRKPNRQGKVRLQMKEVSK